MYTAVKYAHMSFALISISFFLIRASWSVREKPILQRRWVRILPHCIDTLLLACAFYLMFASSLYPQQQPWLSAKIIALLVYIGLGTMAIKRASTARKRLIYAILAVVTFSYIGLVAITKSPLPF